MREIGALKQHQGARADESGQGRHDDKKNDSLRPRDESPLASWVGRNHAAVYRSFGWSATDSLDEGASRRGMIPVIILVDAASPGLP